MKKKRLLYRLIGVGCCFGIMAGLSGCAILPKEEKTLAPPLVEPAKLDYDVASVRKGEIVKAVKGTGTLVPVVSNDLSYSKDGGRLKKIYVAKGDAVKKGQILAEIDTGNLSFDIEQAKIDLEKAQIRLEQLKTQNADKYSLKIAQLDIDSLNLRLTQLNKQLTESRITSPINGIVSYVSDVKQGEVIQAYQPIIKVAETSKLELQYTAINAADLTDVKLGVEANVSIKGQALKGKVVQIPSDVPFDTIKNNPDIGNSVFISLEKMPKDTTVGDLADIQIITSKKENTLIIPKNGLRTAMGRNYVQVLNGNMKRELDVETGIISTTEVEVLKGLKEGDKVILK